MKTEQIYPKNTTTISPNPNYIGGWKMPNLRMFYMTETKPNFWIRFFNRLLIGWKWMSNKEIQETHG